MSWLISLMRKNLGKCDASHMDPSVMGKDPKIIESTRGVIFT